MSAAIAAMVLAVPIMSLHVSALLAHELPVLPPEVG